MRSPIDIPNEPHRLTERPRSARPNRWVTIPAVVATALVAVVASPFLLAAALVIDATRFVVAGTPFMAVRLVAFGLIYLTAEAAGLLLAALAWAFSFSPARMQRWTYAIQAGWAATLLSAVERVFQIRFHVQGTDLVAPGPVVVLSRHTSLVDNLLPARYVAKPGGLRLRYVLKRELMSDPALDVVGNRLPNAFVDRESRESVAAIARLGQHLDPDEGVLIFPEGTRFTSRKLARSRKILERRSPRLAELAGGFKSVLPPRAGGTLALLEATGADVVVLTHRGLDSFARLPDIWRGAMVGRDVHVKLWRIGAQSIPSGRQPRTEWLFEVFQQIDDWINGDADE